MPSSTHMLATLTRVASKYLSLLVVCVASAASAQPTGSWELRVCADPDNLPYSNRAGEGYENRLAQLVATKLGAVLSYAWMPALRKDTDAQLMLRLGECDLVAGVADGVEPFLNTISYFTAITYFVTRQGSGLEDISSLDDPRLAAANVGVDRGSPLDFALQRRVDQTHVRHYLAQDSASAIVQDVASGALDVGIVRGPVAGYFIAQGHLQLSLVPVTPEVDIPFLQLVQPITMAVRRGDDALRDQLDKILAAEWGAVQELLDDMHIARPQVPAPGLPPGTVLVDDPATLRIGVVLPTQTGANPLMPENVEPEASAARNGALLAAELLRGSSVPIKNYLASTPTAAAAVRAANRLAALDGVAALLGGVGVDQAASVAEVANSLALPFMNVADPNPGLRAAACESSVFNIAPDYTTYFAAMASFLDPAAPQELLVVRPATPHGRLLEELFRRAANSTSSSWKLTTIEVEPQAPYYGAALAAMRSASPDVVVLLLDADAQLVFLGQYENAGLTAPVLGLPASGTQLRQYYWTLTRDAPHSGTAPRFAMWDAAIRPSAFNDAYRARFGQQPEAPAWAAYAAVQALQQAALAAALSSTTLLQALLQTDTAYDLAGTPEARFGPVDHQLQAPVYVLNLTAPPPGVRFELAELSSVVAALDVGGQPLGRCP